MVLHFKVKFRFKGPSTSWLGPISAAIAPLSESVCNEATIYHQSTQGVF